MGLSRNGGQGAVRESRKLALPSPPLFHPQLPLHRAGLCQGHSLARPQRNRGPSCLLQPSSLHLRISQSLLPALPWSSLETPARCSWRSHVASLMKYSWAFLPLDIKPSAAPHTTERELASQQTLGRSGRPPWPPTVPPVTVAGPPPPLCSAKGQGSSCCALPQPRGLPATSATRQPSARCVGTSALELGSEGRAAATPHRRVPAPVCPGPPSQVRGGGTLPTSSFSTLVAEGSLPHANKTGLLESTLPLAVWWPAPPCSHVPSSVHTSVRALTHTLSAPRQVPCVEIRLRDVEQNHPSLALQVFTPAPPPRPCGRRTSWQGW
ncbi:uncharacterized protein LOC131383717 [Hylobates moloch]|uniref:uncharacterized protein LOC131383717 n=1 Tax=Hylobates moloch TaxID=81572 RepID=UPI0026753900|nr:uncharacterized protein LOC131383717 [Hylobates moloch]